MPHSKEVWESWGRGTASSEQTHLALDVSQTPPQEFLLRRGDAHQPVPGHSDPRPVNVRTRDGQFHCLVPGCGAFASAAAGAVKRDHFRHATAPAGALKDAHGQERESLWHKTAKHQLAAFLRDSLRSDLVTLEVDSRQVRTPSGTFKPDVYAEARLGDTVVRIAIEYQRSPGDPQTLARKRAGYAAAGVIDWWFYSPWPETCRLRENAQPRNDLLDVDLTAGQQNLVAAQQRFYWYNPITDMVGTPLCVAASRVRLPGGQPPAATRPRWRRPWSTAQWVSLHLDPLGYCSISSTGEFRTPTDRDLDHAARETQIEIHRLQERTQRDLPEPVDQTPEAETPAAEPPPAETPPPGPREQVSIDRPSPDPVGVVRTPEKPRAGLWSRLLRLFGR